MAGPVQAPALPAAAAPSATPAKFDAVGAPGAAPTAPTSLGSVVEQLGAIEQALASLAAAHPAASPVQQQGPVTQSGIQPGTPAAEMFNGLQSFVQQGTGTIAQMRTTAQARAAANGGNPSQTDLVVIQQREQQVQTVQALAAKVQAHPNGVDAQVVAMAKQALANSNANGGNFSQVDLVSINMRIQHNEGTASDAALVGLPKLARYVYDGQVGLKDLTNQALQKANANGGNFDQASLQQIQQGQTWLTGINGALKHLADHSARLTDAQVAQVDQAIQQSRQTGDVSVVDQAVAQVTQGA